MSRASAVIFVPDDTQKGGYLRPLMLQRIMGVPLLTWLTYSLREAGYERFFLVCHGQYLEEAKGCFPKSVHLTTSERDTADMLHVFLSTAEETEQEVLIITGPAVFLPREAAMHEAQDAPQRACVCTVGREEMMAALDEEFVFSQFLLSHGRACTDRDGMFSVTSPEELADWQPILKRMHLYQLAADGVEIWDYDNTYVDPTVSVGAGTMLLPGTILRGRTKIGHDCVIGPNTYMENSTIGNYSRVNASQVYQSVVGSDVQVGPFAMLRPGSKVANRVRIGNFVELKQTQVGEGTSIAHLSYVGDSEIGRGCNLGSGVMTANYDGEQKHNTHVEDDCFIGCNTTLVAPVHVGQGSYVAAGSTITEDVPAMALGISRARQNNKKEWAQRNKK